jgi:hypothetical protein
VSDTSFTKLFSSITKSTVWCEPHTTFRVWITLLAECNRKGEVHGSIPGLANLARVTIAECETAMETFLAPDPYSRTPDHEGRRIEVIVGGGWRLLNYGLYRERRDTDAVKEQKREHMQRVRAEEKINSECGKNISTSGDESHEWNESGYIAEAEAEAEADKSKSKSERARPAPLVLPDFVPADAWQDWHAYRNGRKGWTRRARELSLRKLTELWAQGYDPRAVIEQSIERGWTGLFPVHEDRARAGPAASKPGKQMQGLMALEAMKSGNRMADGRSADGAAEALPALTGPHARR